MDQYVFAGLKVLDLGTVIAAPVAATILADFGADVIKVEPPGEGDLLRMLSDIPTTPDADNNFFWHMDARNKRSITLNLKTSEGMEILHRLIKECDVFITNQPFPVRRSLKLSYDDLKPLNPTMIYASLSAFGEEGPDRDKKAFDLYAYWARSGLMDLVRSPGSLPSQSLPGMGDHPTAIALYASIVTALLQRQKTGEGAMVHTSLLANGLWSAASIAQGGLAGGNMDDYRKTNSVPGVTGRVYHTKDGRFLQLTMVRTEEEFFLLLAATDLIYLLEDERFSTAEGWMENKGALSDYVQEVLLTQTSDEWLVAFKAMGVPAERVVIIDEALKDEQITINEMVVPLNDESVDIPLIVNHPLKVSSAAQVGPKRGPDLGEHTDQILEELGYSAEQVRDLKSKEVF
jgi:crotonobetainyl-CoA:carnitine CoA-transferase CaiB-like acyl-CoA transferase